MPVSSASSPDVTAGSMATTTRVICGAERSRLADDAARPVIERQVVEPKLMQQEQVDCG
jgi:hypothetical protein